MRHFWLFLSVVMVLFYATLTPAVAQMPRTLSYQGYAENATALPLEGQHNVTLKIYTGVGVQLFQEMYGNVDFHNGIFNIIIGRGATLPASMKFDEPYYLGVDIDGQGELVPRTEFTSAPYALHSSVADVALGVDTGAAVVKTINGQKGVIILQGGGGTTITNVGGIFTVSSSGGGGTGIQGVQNSDGTLTILNPNGPTATIGVADGGITTAKLGANAVTAAKINSTGAVTDQVLVANGTGGAAWQTISISGGLVLPFAQSVSSAQTLFSLINSGSGAALSGTGSASAVAGVNGNTTHATGIGVLGLTSDGGAAVTTNSAVCGSTQTGFGVTGNSTSGEAVRGFSSSSGIGIHGTVGSGASSARAAFFENTNSSTTGNVLEALCLGSGKAGQFKINNSSNSDAAIYGESNGTGSAGDFYKVTAGPNPTLSARAGSSMTSPAFFARTDGTGSAAIVRNYNATNSQDALVTATLGTGRAGYFQISNNSNSSTALEATTNGSGHCIYATAIAASASAVFGFHAGSGIGVTGSTSDGTGVYGYSVNNIGVRGVHNAANGFTAGVKGETNSAAAGNSSTDAVSAVLGIVTPTTGGVWSSGVRGLNNSTNAAGCGVVGYQAGNGFGVYGEVAGGNGGSAVRGVAPNGSWAIYSAGKLEVSIDNALKPATNTWTIASDARLKRDIRPFSDGLDVLMKINPVRYYYNGLAGLPTEKENIGIIAQDMQRIAPYTVETSLVKMHPQDKDNSEILTYNSNAITYVTINAVKELNDKIKQLEARLDQMEQLLQSKGIDPGASITGTK